MKFRLVALLCVSVAAALAQPSQEILDVTQWRLNFTVTISSSGNTTGPDGTRTWDFHAVATGSAILTPGGGKLTYQGLTKILVTGGYTSKWVLPGGNCSEESNNSFSAVPTNSDVRMAYVNMIRKDGYQIDPGPDSVRFPATTVEVCGDTTTTYHATDGFSWTPVWADPVPYPPTGTFLSGTMKKKSGLIPGQLPSNNDGDYQIDFTMVPDVQEELTLNVESSGYQKWRPQANLDGSAGDPLQLTATLVSSTGKDPNGKIDTLTWELKNTSREPGIALNWPLNAKDTEYDLKLDPAGPPSLYDDTRQKVERFVVQGYTDSISVLPYDWGAWADLEVTAVLTDGRKVTGKLKSTGDSPVRLPRRAADSHIADAWKDEWAGKGVTVGADNADDESKPAGDTTPGDGLTAYEEYRGFYENAIHIGGDPGKKDFFVVDKSGVAAGGIGKFQRVSKLAVHGKMLPGELPDDRVVNKNFKEGAHVVAQHGVIIQLDENLSGECEARGGPSTPKNISIVALANDANTWDSTQLAVDVAHELFHCVNTYHHGEVDRKAKWRVGSDGILREFYDFGPAEGIPIRVLTESGTDVTDAKVADFGVAGGPVWIGMNQGQHSGYENCLMRYDNANAYISKADPSVRYSVTELSGHAICTSPVGVEVNKPERNTPQPRYGNAQTGRGNCIEQLLVTDAVNAPKR